MVVTGRYSSGKVGGSRTARAQLVGQQLLIQTPEGGSLCSAQLAACEVLPPVGPGLWVIKLPDYAEFAFQDDDFGARLLAAAGRRDGIGVLERGWVWAAVALVVAIVGVWAMLEKGVPVASRIVAERLPADLEQTLQRESITVLDKWLFAPSATPPERQQALQERFAAITASDDRYASFELVFRSAPGVGANAFAMPGGTVLLTDALVELAESDDELVAVLAHEVGHLAERHSLRILLQDSLTALFVAGLTGDPTSMAALSASIPTVLMQSKYSREFEREADEFAFDYLRREGLDPGLLRQLLTRLEAADGAASDVPDWLSTHPATEERVPSP